VTLENLIGKGLQREPASAEEIHRFLARITIKLADAQKDTISLDSQFDLACAPTHRLAEDMAEVMPRYVVQKS
jgi:hypothetical protein